ncbi:type I-E CRISPR-associated protein Cas7/Cse4/CasC [Streptomyces bluensis]|uniref:Type I-E CRISPR-associated protein Cas7/Cse4/CasC n=1 Tax=Streptomyces bluensis TaxID=33897 RepID=A0ABW6UVU0_9ACTN
MPARYIDFHVLQTIPASLLNRGEDNEPKTMLMGGTVRAMVSSQSWKRSLRLDLENELDEHAARTRMLPLRVADALRASGWPEDLATFAGAQIARSASREGLKTEPRQKGITSAMLYLPREVLDELVSLCEKHRQALEETAAQLAAEAAQAKTENGKKTKKKPPAVPAVLPTREVASLITRRTATINLFGRMLAEIPGAHVDGAVQIAPAFTTHKSDRQPDFFTAVEDWGDPNDSGSAHLQTAFFTTGVLYRYATVNLTELTHNLGGDHEQARHLLGLFADSFLLSLPQAKKTSTAPHTVPYLAHYAVRDRRPVSYAAAFEQPVKATRDGGYTQPALTALAQHAGALNRLIGTRRLIAHGHTIDTSIHPKPIEHLGTHHTSFEDLTDALTAAAAQPSATTPVTA